MEQTVNTDIWHALLSAGIVVQLTLLILIAASVTSWAIIWSKSQQIKKTVAANRPFYARFLKASSFEALNEELETYPSSNLVPLFEAGFSEMQNLARSARQTESEQGIVLRGIDNVERALRNAMEREIEKLENSTSILATIGSTGPFVGLFGTVWGIMNSFQKIGATGSANLAVVAPGISEALVATAVGLFAAIPAVVAYNQFNTRIRRIEIDMGNFCSDFTNIAKRNFFQEG